MKIGNNIKRLLKLLLSLGLISVLVVKLDIMKILYIITQLNIGNFILIVIMQLLMIVINSVKWKTLLEEVSLLKLINLNLIAQFYSLILVGQISGEASKMLFVKKLEGNTEKSIASICVDKVTGLIGVVLVGIIGSILSKKNLTILAMVFVSIFIILVCLLICIQFDILYNWIYRILLNLTKKNNKFNVLLGIVKSWKEYANNKIIIIKGISLGMIVQLIGVLIYYYLSKIIGFDIPFVEYCWIYAVVSVALFLPISIAGIGVREVTLVGLLALYDVSAESAMTISMIIFITGIVIGLIGGIVNMRYIIKDKREAN